MLIERLTLADFRNLKNLDIELSPDVNIFYGGNAQGKTNILESIYLCSTGRSQRTRNDSQMIMFGENEAHIRVYIKKKQYSDRIDVHIKNGDKKGIAINGVAIKKSAELFGTLRTVIFSPEDLQLIKSGPSERRRFIDLELCQLSSIYYYNLQQFYKVLKHRNIMLKKIKKQKCNFDSDSMYIWDSQLVKYGIDIIKSRRNFVHKLSSAASKRYLEITGGNEQLLIKYKPHTDESELSEKLSESIEKDIMFGSTSTGPHRDNIEFFIDDHDAKIYGSQGQQRTAALSSKMAEIDMIISETGQTPVLLLDDVLSELDEHRQKFLLDSLCGIQTVVTCTGMKDILKLEGKPKKIFHVSQGNII